MPVRDSMRFLPRVVPPLLNAGRPHGVEFIFVDNGSVDGSREYLQSLEAADVRVFLRDGDTVAGVRNFGAAHARGSVLSFIDADCEIGEEYFAAALSDLQATGASATGHPYALPGNPGWIERAWHELHAVERPRDVAYLNAGNFVVTRAAFERVGGFRADLHTGEDAELGQRLIAAGARIHANPAVRAVHLGNPPSLREFYRRAVWHGLGMFGTVRWGSIDKPTAMMAAHLLATLGGVFVLAGLSAQLPLRAGIALALQLAVPLATVAYRQVQVRRWAEPARGVLLYWLYYWARLHALLLIVLGRGYRK